MGPAAAAAEEEVRVRVAAPSDLPIFFSSLRRGLLLSPSWMASSASGITVSSSIGAVVVVVVVVVVDVSLPRSKDRISDACARSGGRPRGPSSAGGSSGRPRLVRRPGRLVVVLLPLPLPLPLPLLSSASPPGPGPSPPPSPSPSPPHSPPAPPPPPPTPSRPSACSADPSRLSSRRCPGGSIRSTRDAPNDGIVGIP